MHREIYKSQVSGVYQLKILCTMAESIRLAGGTTDVASQLDSRSRSANPPVGRCDRTDWFSFGITTVIALVMYLSTLAPDVTLEDSGMLSVTAMYAGVPSPPGYPAWTIYSWLFVKLLPFSNIAWRVAVGSAVATAVACGLVALMVSRCGPILFADVPAFIRLKPLEQKWLRGVCGAVAGLLLAFSGIVSDIALIAEIWALSLLLFVSILHLVTHWVFDPERRWPLFTVFFVFGLLLTSSQEMIVTLPGLIGAVMLSDHKLGRDLALTFLPLAAIVTAGFQWGLWIVFPTRLNWPMLGGFAFAFLFGIAVAVRTRGVGSEWRVAMLCAVSFLSGLAFYLYIPIASMTNPPVNWGYPRTVEGFFHVLARGQFERAIPTDNLRRFVGQLWICAKVLPTQVGWPCLVFAGLAICSLHRMSRTGRLWMLGLVAVWLGVVPLMVAELNPPPDRAAQELIALYFTAAHALFALWAGVGLTLLGALMARVEGSHPTQARQKF